MANHRSLPSNVRTSTRNEESKFNAIGYLRVYLNGQQVANSQISDNEEHALNQEFGGIIEALKPGQKYRLPESSEEIELILIRREEKEAPQRKAREFSLSNIVE